MESTVTQDLEGHSVWLPEIKMEPEDNDESASEPRVIEVEPTPPEFAFVKVEPMSEDPHYIECQPEIETLYTSDATEREPTSPPGTPTHSTTLDNITSQLDQVTHESSKTQLQFDFQPELFVKQESKLHQCTVCNKVFTRKRTLQLHFQIHSKICDKKCDVCGKSFTSIEYLKKHQRIHKPHEHVCLHCSKSFSKKEYLTKHLPVHSATRLEKCDVCGKCFYHRVSLKKHQEIHEGRGYVCAHCDQKFVHKCNLTRHIKQQHMCEGDRIRFACSTCRKSYSSNFNLSKHQKTHNSQHCDICNLECNDSRSLRTHMKVAHRREKKYKCITCEKLFFSLGGLACHEKVHISKPLAFIKPE